MTLFFNKFNLIAFLYKKQSYQIRQPVLICLPEEYPLVLKEADKLHFNMSDSLTSNFWSCSTALITAKTMNLVNTSSGF